MKNNSNNRKAKMKKVIIMLSLNNLIGVGDLANSTVKLNIMLCIDKEKFKKFLSKKKIKLDEEATKFLNNSKIGCGTLDYGPREIDFFPEGNSPIYDSVNTRETELILK